MLEASEKNGIGGEYLLVTKMVCVLWRKKISCWQSEKERKKYRKNTNLRELTKRQREEREKEEKRRQKRFVAKTSRLAPFLHFKFVVEFTHPFVYCVQFVQLYLFSSEGYIPAVSLPMQIVEEETILEVLPR